MSSRSGAELTACGRAIPADGGDGFGCTVYAPDHESRESVTKL
jgi:hypothetical protein